MLTQQNKIANAYHEAVSDCCKTGRFSDGHSVHTPKPLVEEILGHIDLVNKKNILVLFNVEFVVSLVYTYNVAPEKITFYSDSANKNRFAIDMGVKYTDIMPTHKQFDVVVGNPPYRKDDNKTFYKKFVTLSKKIANQVALVVPSSNFKDIKEFNGLTYYKFCGEAFTGIRMIVSWFIWSKDLAGPTIILSNTGTYSTATVRVAPTEDIERFKLVNDLLSKNYTGLTVNNGTLNRNRVVEDPNGVWCIWSAGKRGGEFDKIRVTASLESELSGLGEHKVVFSGDYTPYAIGPVKYADPTHGCAMKAHYIKVDNPDQAQNLINYLESKFIKFITPVIKGTSAKNGKTSFNKIPKMDLNRTWTDAELYQHFGLTDDEIAYIEANVK